MINVFDRAYLRRWARRDKHLRRLREGYMTLKKKPAHRTPAPVKPARAPKAKAAKKSAAPVREPKAEPFAPFLKASELQGESDFHVAAVRSANTQFGPQVLIDGTIDGEKRTWAIKQTGGTLVDLLRYALMPGSIVCIAPEPFTASDGHRATYVRVVGNEG